MPERRAGTRAGAVSKQGGTRRVPTDPSRAVRVWGEAGITVAITEEPPQYVKVMFGHERLAPDDKLETLDRYQALIDEYNEGVVERQAKKYGRLLRAVKQDAESPPRRRRRAT